VYNLHMFRKHHWLEVVCTKAP